MGDGSEAASSPQQARRQDGLSAYVSAEEAAAILGCTARTVARAVKIGHIPAVRLARRYRIPRQAVEALAVAQAPAPAGGIDYLAPLAATARARRAVAAYAAANPHAAKALEALQAAEDALRGIA